MSARVRSRRTSTSSKKVSCGYALYAFVERQEEQHVEAALRQQVDLLVQRRETFRGVFGPQEGLRMTLESEDADEAACLAQRLQARQHGPVTDVDAVEDADAQQEIGAGFIAVDGADDAHGG